MKYLLLYILINISINQLLGQVIIIQPNDSTVCENSNATFNIITDTIYNYTFQWQQDSAGLNNWIELPDDTTEIVTLQNAQLSYNNYRFRCIVDTNGVFIDTSESASLFVKQLPIAYFSNNTVCFGDSTEFINLSTGSNTWFWNFNDNGNSFAFEPSYIFSNAGSSDVSLIATSEYGCKDTVINQATIFPSPQVDFNVTEVCLNDTTVFTNFTSNADTYSWDFGENGATSTVNNPVHLYQTADEFIVTLMAFNTYGCIDSLIATAKVNFLPEAVFIADTVCFGFPTMFTNASTLDVAWNWDFDNNGEISIEQNPSYVFTTVDTFNVQLIATTINSCKDTVNKNVIVYPLPQVDFTASVVCYKDTSQFANLTTGAISYLWDFDENNSLSNLENPEYSYGQSGNYMVGLLATTDMGCSDSITKNVIVNSLPSPVISGPLQVCSNESGMIYTTPYVIGNSYQWAVSNGIIESGQDSETIIIHWNSDSEISTNLSVTETIDNTGCNLTAPLYNVILTNDFAPDKAQIELKGEHILVCMDFNVDSWQWYYNGSLIPEATDHYYQADATAIGDYWCLTSFQNGCDTESEHFNFLTIGIEDNDFSKTIKIYPNPSNGVFYVEMENEYNGEIYIEVIDMLGNEILNVKYEKYTAKLFVPISILNNGTFFLSVKFEKSKSLIYNLIIY